MTMERYICIHGHFYQPPRENAWLEYVEWQDSAYPYHDWNERVTAECYLPNAASRILDGDGNIKDIVSNYARMSFNFGPTLLAWLETASPDVYRAIIEADVQSRERFSGHGSAIAQAYNHLIMPLANHRDRYSQVYWGIRDFQHRFGRNPEGMWLPETAVDLETLDILAEQGIKFTILAPHQARRICRIGTKDWKEVNYGSLDTTRAYRIDLHSGRQMSIFFYNGPIASAVSFEDVLKNGDVFVKRLLGPFSGNADHSQIVHIATDGETYGHHHRFGDMALAYALNRIETEGQVKLTNYGEFLEKFPPEYRVEINEKTSWSCAHGIDRWWSDDGCSTGAGDHPDWNQKWRTPLRNAFDFLRDKLAGPYEESAAKLFKDPWEARNGYIDVILDRAEASKEKFLTDHASRELSEAEKVAALKLLELQRHAMLMYTSCGWYFDELSRPEPLQVMQYAGRVVQLAQDLFGKGLEEPFLKILEGAKSNIPAQGDGRSIFERLIRPSMINLTDVAAHHAVLSLFEEHRPQSSIYCYDVKDEDYYETAYAEARLIAGRSQVISGITGETEVVSFGVLQPAEYQVAAGAVAGLKEQAFREMMKEISGADSSTKYDILETLLNRYLGNTDYSLRSLFHDEQRRVLTDILEKAMMDINTVYGPLYRHHFPPARILSELSGPIPTSLHAVAEVILNMNLHHAASGDTIDIESVKDLVAAAEKWQIVLDNEGIGYDYKITLEKMMTDLATNEADAVRIKNVLEAVRLAGDLPFTVDLWKVQNMFWDMFGDAYLRFRAGASSGDAAAKEWVKVFANLGKQLKIKVD